MDLVRCYRKEQSAFLRRPREGWGDHLARVRAFLAEGLEGARGPCAILGAGAGLEVPWAAAPPGTVGWDLDPWSRVRTCLRHGRWAPWVFEDLTGGMGALAALAARHGRQPWSGRPRDPRRVALRLAGLVDTLAPDAGPLRAWIARHRPGTLLAANVMGQFGVMAQRILEAGLGGAPWREDPEEDDPLAAALEGWTVRALGAFLAVLRDSGAELWLVHDLAVVHGEAEVALEGEGPWTACLRSPSPLEVEDPLCGVDAGRLLPGTDRRDRWIWPVAPGQIHLVEALHVPAHQT